MTCFDGVNNQKKNSVLQGSITLSSKSFTLFFQVHNKASRISPKIQHNDLFDGVNNQKEWCFLFWDVFTPSNKSFMM